MMRDPMIVETAVPPMTTTVKAAVILVRSETRGQVRDCISYRTRMTWTEQLTQGS